MSTAPPSAAAAAAGSQPSTSTTLPELPWSFHECPTETLVVLISHMLNLLIQHNDQVVLTPDSLTRFHSRAAPGITVVDYLQRIVKYTNMEKIPLLSLLAYIDITCTNLPTFTLSSLTVHRFLIAGVCAGSKAQCDVFCTNSHYAKVGGIKVTELNGLEREFLKVTQWNLCCKAELLQRYYTSLIKSHGGFTQAEEPTENPLDVDLQSSAAPSPEDVPEEETQMDTESPVAGPSTVPQPAQAVDIPLPPNKRGRRREPHNGAQSVPEEGVSHPNGTGTTSTVNSAPGSVSGRMDMDVDEHETPSSNERIASSPASSSVPSSSRSSLRTRNVSMTQLDPSAGTAASPRIDTTPATGRVGMEVDPQAQAAQAVAPTADTTSEQDADGKSGHHGAGGKLLKSLVGGIFRRHDSAHHSDPPQPTTTSQAHTNSNAHRLVPPHQSPGRRVKSPLMNAYSQGEPPALATPVTPRVRTREETTSEC